MKRFRARYFDRFSLVNYLFFVIVAVLMLYPFWHTLMGSFMGQGEYYRKLLLLWPDSPTLSNYQSIFSKGDIWIPMVNTVLITVIGTAVSVSFTLYISYGLSKRFLGSRVVMQFIVFTMIINPGLIPDYLLYKSLGLINHFAVYILPSLSYPFFIIIARTYFQSLSKELEDASRIDGCNEFGHFFRIAIPLSKPIIATIGLFLAVGYWNTFFPSLFFVTDEHRKTLQEYLYRLVTEDVSQYFAEDVYFKDTTKLANIIIATLPILVVYPFVQKYFVKGIMMGAVKG